MDLPALKHARDHHEIPVGRIGAATDQHLIDRHSRDLPDRRDVVRGMGPGDHRNDRTEVEIDRPVVRGVGVGGQGRPIPLPLLRTEKQARRPVARKYRSRHAEFSAHIRDGGTFGNAQGGDPRPRVFQSDADVAFRGEDTEQFQYDVLGRTPFAEPANEVHAEDLRIDEMVRAPRHRGRDVHPPHAHGDHAHGAAGRGMAVGTDQAKAGAAEALQMHLMADAVPRLGELDAVLVGDRLQIAVIIRVLETVLKGVVVDIGNRIGFRQRDSHRFELEIRHGSQRVLRQGLVYADADLIARSGLSRDQMTADDLVVKVLSHMPASPLEKILTRLFE